MPEDAATTNPQVPEEHQDLQQWLSQRLLDYPSKNTLLQSIYAEEITALQAFISNQTSPKEAAQAITQPISNTPMPDLDVFEPQYVALCRLLTLLVDALLEWPSSRTPDLIALLTAMSNVPDSLHRGDALDNDDEPLTWSGLPCFGMVWRDATWMMPGDIIEKCAKRRGDSAGVMQQAADRYLKVKDVEARLVAAGLLDMKMAFRYVIYTLEWHVDNNNNNKDKKVEEAEETRFWADELFEPQFHMPAVTCYVRHTGRKLYEGLCSDEMRGWDRRDIPSVMKHFDNPSERWAFWKERLRRVAKDGPDEFVRRSAGRAVGYMEDVVA